MRHVTCTKPTVSTPTGVFYVTSSIISSPPVEETTRRDEKLAKSLHHCAWSS